MEIQHSFNEDLENAFLYRHTKFANTERKMLTELLTKIPSRSPRRGNNCSNQLDCSGTSHHAMHRSPPSDSPQTQRYCVQSSAGWSGFRCRHIHKRIAAPYGDLPHRDISLALPPKNGHEKTTSRNRMVVNRHIRFSESHEEKSRYPAPLCLLR